MALSFRLILPTLAIVVLAGCSAGAGGAGESGAGEGAGAGANVADCVMGHTWNADVPDIGEQLFAQLQANGTPATSAVASGTQDLTWGMDGAVQVDTNYTFTVVSPLSEGLILTMQQIHAGPTVGQLTIAGDIATPTSWDSSGYTISTVMDINGQAASMNFPIPDAGLGAGVLLTVTCEGNSMTTFSEGGFVTTKWSRAD